MPAYPVSFCLWSQDARTWSGVPTLRVEFFSGDPEVRSEASSECIHVDVDGVRIELTRAEAVALADRLGEAVVADREFLRTAGRHREDGSYEVRRRGADSAGNAKVFPDFDAACRLYDRLPEAFDADDVGRTGITGSRRHMLVRHFAEHPAFDCEVTSRSPLRARKRDADGVPAVEDGIPRSEEDLCGRPDATGD